jgi:hypothetical protein
MSNDTKSDAVSRPPVRSVARQLFQDLVSDVWPSPAAVVDFGIASGRHYAALRDAVMQRGVTVEELDDAACDGPALTALMRPESPYHGLTFTTSWDGLMRRVTPPADLKTAAKFRAGRLFATPGVLEVFSQADVHEGIKRHLAGDWGEVSDADRAENEAALKDGDRLLSVYRTSEEQTFWVLTEADRSLTTVLLPDEY